MIAVSQWCSRWRNDHYTAVRDWREPTWSKETPQCLRRLVDYEKLRQRAVLHDTFSGCEGEKPGDTHAPSKAEHLPLVGKDPESGAVHLSVISQESGQGVLSQRRGRHGLAKKTEAIKAGRIRIPRTIP